MVAPQLAPRSVVPVYSLIVATRPLPAAFWDAAGLAGGQTFTDHRHLIVYGQRTADDRLVFGGRGAPYHWRSRIAPAFDRDERVFGGLRAAARDLFPALRPSRFTPRLGRPAGHPARLARGRRLDTDGLGWAGGYVGDGVGTSHLAGRTLAALILGRDDPVTRLPWVGHRSRRWEPEPLRWLLVNAGLRLMTPPTTEERSRAARACSPRPCRGRSAAEHPPRPPPVEGHGRWHRVVEADSENAEQGGRGDARDQQREGDAPERLGRARRTGRAPPLRVRGSKDATRAWTVTTTKLMQNMMWAMMIVREPGVRRG